MASAIITSLVKDITIMKVYYLLLIVKYAILLFLDLLPSSDPSNVASVAAGAAVSAVVLAIIAITIIGCAGFMIFRIKKKSYAVTKSVATCIPHSSNQELNEPLLSATDPSTNASVGERPVSKTGALLPAAQLEKQTPTVPNQPLEYDTTLGADVASSSVY